jgi:type IV secretion system protein VirB9
MALASSCARVPTKQTARDVQAVFASEVGTVGSSQLEGPMIPHPHVSLSALLLPVMLAACATTHVDTIVDTPGMPNAELALQRSLDRVHGFLGELKDRIGAPAEQIAMASGAQLPAAPAPRASQAPASPIQLGVRQLLHDATATTGKDGTVYFAFAGGTPRLRCRPGSVCLLRFAHGERLSLDDVRVEDATNWTVHIASAPSAQSQETVLAIMPKSGASATLLHVRSNLRGYHIALMPSNDASMLLASFTYRHDDPSEQDDPGLAAAGVADAGGAIRSTAPHYGNPDFNYRILGSSPPWKPVRVYRDGGKTYVQFPRGGVLSAPRLLLSATTGNLTPITYRIEGDSYVVDRILEDALLVAGTGSQQQTVLLRHIKAS